LEKILVVEDDESLARGIDFALTKENWQVTLAKTLDEGYTWYKSKTFDLILLDVMLPDGSGFDLCRKIRETSNVPIIFLTACDEEVNVVQGLDIGADDYITKPFRVRELVSRIRAALRRSSAGSSMQLSGVVKTGDITLNFLECRLFKGDTEIFPTPSEFKLISVFIRNPLQVLSREQLLEKLWDMDGEFFDENTLCVYIRRLREKIEDDPAKPGYIVTVRGYGYKWNQSCI